MAVIQLQCTPVRTTQVYRGQPVPKEKVMTSGSSQDESRQGGSTDDITKIIVDYQQLCMPHPLQLWREIDDWEYCMHLSTNSSTTSVHTSTKVLIRSHFEPFRGSRPSVGWLALCTLHWPVRTSLIAAVAHTESHDTTHHSIRKKTQNFEDLPKNQFQ